MRLIRCRVKEGFGQRMRSEGVAEAVCVSEEFRGNSPRRKGRHGDWFISAFPVRLTP